VGFIGSFGKINITLNMNDLIIPFGKYQGYALDALFRDKSYLQWFLCESDSIMNHRVIHRELIRRLIFNDNFFSKSSQNTFKSNQFENSLIERNKLLAELINPDFDWDYFIANQFEHEVKGEVSNLIFFNQNITFQLDYKNDNIENFTPVHFNIDFQVEINDDFQYLLNELIKIDLNDPDSRTILITYKINTLGFSEEDIIRIFQTNKITLLNLNPKPKDSSIVTKGSKANSNESEHQYPF
jgi:hypothetical protein